MIRTRIHLHSLEERIVPSVTLVTDINRSLYGAYDSHPLVALDNTVLFRSTAFDDESVWKSDGTPAGTGLAGPGVQLGYEGVEFAGARYFTGHDEAHGNELWRTDGTPRGTRLVADTFAGPLDGYPRFLTVAGNALYFVANRNQLWRTDGTTAGTIWFQTLGINQPDYFLDGIEELAAVGNRLYIKVQGLTGTELWTSNGTTLGTYRVADLAARGYHLLDLLGAAGNSFFFSTTSAVGAELWKTNGTAAGTKLVRGDVNLSYAHAAVVEFNDRLYFAASDATNGNELWVTDGTLNGTTLVKDINPTGSATPEELVVQGSYLYFTADDGTTGRELWRTDGTADGTIRLADLFTGPESSDPEFLTPSDAGLYFTAFNPATGEEVWKTDGTPEGTVQVADLEPGPASSFPAWLVSVDDRVFWVANTRADGSSLWVAGPGAGPTLLSPVPARTETSTFGSGVTIGGVHYFVGHDGDAGGEIWRTDGTAAGTWMLKDIVPGRGSSFPTSLTAVDGTLYFTAFVPGLGTELWASDGTTDGTRLVKDIEPGGDSFTTGPNHLSAFQGKLIFTANTAGEGRELWVSDGTTDGTRLVKDIYPGTGSAFSFTSPKFTELNGYLYFAAKDPDHGLQVWRTDGTQTGTTLVTDLPAPWAGVPDDGLWRPEHVGNHIVFWGRSGSQKTLWSTDGTAGGTVSLGLAQTYIDQFGDRGVLGDKLLLWAKDATHPSALWATDGTPAGTTRIPSAPAPTSLVTAGGLAYFTDSNTQQGLWRTDGTAAGTYRLRTFSQPMGGLVAFGGQLYFVGHDLVHGYGLWTTDGTTAGTHLVDDLAGSQPKFQRPSLLAIGDALFLQVGIVLRPGKGGSVLWRSDGTEAGTHPIAPGFFTGITELNGVPLFSHDDGLTGSELWRYDPIATGIDHYALENGLRLDVPAATGLLANDADGGGKPLTATPLSKPKNGWLTLRPDGSFFYQPFSRDFSGTDTFTYRADAGGEQSPPVTVSIDVDLVNQAPVPANDTAAGRAGNPLTVRVLANDADPDNDTLTVSSFTQGTSGRVSKVGNVLLYTPRVAGAQTDTFTYSVRDPRGESATATVTINLTAAPPPRVTAVRLFPGPGTGSINLMTLGTRVLPFQQFSGIEVTFSADVSVAADDLRLIGSDGGAYGLSGFAYDPARRTARWAIDGPAAATWADRLTILIDGSAATGVTGTTGIALGDWTKTVSVLIGDFDGNGIVTAADRTAVRSRYGAVSALLRLYADIDGNGVVDAADMDLVTANLGGRRV